ncbi:DUF2066 domain-containing protein [Rhizobium sp. LjRoot254]|uniref:DUF2066 domain-containing protein n=1 Tax=Rhizobium sp. LjRoot254 TaxID=3342297 RepID=UPI003ECE53F6
MTFLRFAGAVLLSINLLASRVPAAEPDDLYSSQAIVTGQGEKNRQPGFRDCLDRVLVKVSGDQRLPRLPQADALRARAGDFVASFAYRDRLAGKPIHDEQGTYDRPHDLTCRYDRKTVDDLLAGLGSRPWPAERPTFLIVLDVKRGGQAFRATADDMRDLAMRESFALGAAPLALKVTFPAAADAASLDAGGLVPSDGVLPLSGSLVWSDADLGWVATWRLRHDGETYRWVVRGVNFDEAFRVAMRGAAQILSGNGAPQ